MTEWKVVTTDYATDGPKLEAILNGLEAEGFKVRFVFATPTGPPVVVAYRDKKGKR